MSHCPVESQFGPPGQHEHNFATAPVAENRPSAGGFTRKRCHLENETGCWLHRIAVVLRRVNNEVKSKKERVTRALKERSNDQNTPALQGPSFDAIEALTVNIESLHSSVSGLHAIAQSHDAQIVALLTQSKQDAENIGALARIAEIHERRLTQLEGGDTA